MPVQNENTEVFCRTCKRVEPARIFESKISSEVIAALCVSCNSDNVEDYIKAKKNNESP